MKVTFINEWKYLRDPFWYLSLVVLRVGRNRWTGDAGPGSEWWVLGALLGFTLVIEWEKG